MKYMEGGNDVMERALIMDRSPGGRIKRLVGGMKKFKDKRCL